jgi:hypothetical protein
MTTALKLFLTLAICVSIAAETPSPPQLLGSWPGFSRGPASSVVKVDSTLYAALKTGGLVIYKVQPSQILEKVGQLEFTQVCNDVQVSGNLAYVALEFAGLGIVDVSDPAHPFLISTIDTPGSAKIVTLIGNTAYVADWTGGLQIIDVSDSASPKILGSYLGASAVWDVTVRNSLAYLAADSKGFDIVDVSNPSSPVRLGRYPAGGYVFHIAVDGNTAFIAPQGKRVAALDVSDPANIKLITTYGYTNATSLAVDSSHLYLAAFGWGTLFASVDVSNPTNATEVGRLPGVTGSGRMAIDAGVVWLPSDAVGIRAINISNPPSFQVISSTETAGETSDVFVRGDTAFVADGNAGLQVVDISDATKIHSINRYVYNGGISVFRATNSIGALITSQGSVEFVDIGDRSNVTLISRSAPPMYYGATTMEIAGRRAYVGGRGLWLVNFEDAVNPTTTIMLTNTVSVYEVSRKGSILYVTTRGAIIIFDISDPDNPRMVGQHLPPNQGRTWSFQAFGVHGDIGFASTDSFGLEAVDVRDPRHPVSLGNSLVSVGFGQFFGDGEYGFCAAGNWCMLDIHDPSAVQFVYQNLASPSGAFSIVADRGYLCLGASGLAVYQMPVVPPVIVEQPKSALLASGQSWTMNIAASGGAPLSYQWFRDGYAILGATQSSFTVKSSVAGEYKVNVSNSAGAISSESTTIATRTAMHFEQTWFTPLKPLNIEFNDHYAYMSAGSIYIFDVTDPANPSLADIFDHARIDARAIRFANGLAYVADGASLSIWDFANSPLLPIARVTFPFGTTDVYIHGTKALVALGQNSAPYGVALVDISNPRSPSLISIWDPSYAPMKVAGTTSRMVGCAGYEGFRTFDEANPSIFAGAYITDGIVSNPVVIGDLAIASLDQYESLEGTIPPGIRIFDVSQPSRPAGISRIAMSTAPSAIGGDGEFFYAGFEGVGFKAYNFAAPTKPELIGSYDNVNLHPYFIKVASPYIYLCDTVNGTIIYKASPDGDLALQTQLRPDGGVTLSWPAGFGGIVQQSSSLNSPAWVDLPSGSQRVEISPNMAAAFYRLKMP